MFADLHIHSWFSDGTLSPIEIIQKAESQNVTLISICDHNLLDSYCEIESLCENNNITVILGVEITSIMDDIEYHILAYGFDKDNKAINDLLDYNRGINFEMGKLLIEKMSNYYPNISLNDFLSFKRNRKNGGWESIDYLRNKGFVTSWESFLEIANKYGSAPEKNFLSPMEVIKIIHNAGGYAVLAHLCHYEKSDFENYKTKAIQFIKMGIDGFECYYPAHTIELTDMLVKLCHMHDLLITAGSDDHGRFIGAPRDEYFMGAVKIRTEQLSLKNLVN